MNRLGTALTPLVLRAEIASGALDLDLSPVVCATTDQAIADFPRRALVDAALSGTAATGVDIALRSVYSTNGGATCVPLAAVQSRQPQRRDDTVLAARRSSFVVR